MKNYEIRYPAFFMIIAVIGLMMFGGCTSIPQTEGENTALTGEFINAYNQALKEPLEKATAEISDPDLAQFSGKLVSSYKLETTTADTENLADMVPDIEGITRTASDTMLTEAGKNIEDKEIAEFYNSFINSIGVK